jgi:hypothetical protein
LPARHRAAYANRFSLTVGFNFVLVLALICYLLLALSRRGKQPSAWPHARVFSA